MLEELDGVPATEVIRRGGQSLLDFGERVFYGGVEPEGGFGGHTGVRRLDRLVEALVMQGARRDDGAPQRLRELRQVDLVAVLLEEVGHVQRDHHGKAEVDDLRGEIQVALEVGRVDQIDHAVGTFVDEVIARDDLLGRVRGERVNTRQVRDGHGLVA